MIMVDPCLRKVRDSHSGQSDSLTSRVPRQHGPIDDTSAAKRYVLRTDSAKSQASSTSTLGLTVPDLTQTEDNNQDPVRALATPSDNAEEGDDFNIFQFFADGPSTQDSLPTTASGTPAKSVITIAESSSRVSMSPRLSLRQLPRVEQSITEGEQTERWFTKVESML